MVPYGPPSEGSPMVPSMRVPPWSPPPDPLKKGSHMVPSERAPIWSHSAHWTHVPIWLMCPFGPSAHLAHLAHSAHLAHLPTYAFGPLSHLRFLV